MKYAYEVKKENSIEVDYGFDTEKEARSNITKGWRGFIVSYDKKDTERVKRAYENGCIDTAVCNFVKNV